MKSKVVSFFLFLSCLATVLSGTTGAFPWFERNQHHGSESHSTHCAVAVDATNHTAPDDHDSSGAPNFHFCCSFLVIAQSNALRAPAHDEALRLIVFSVDQPTSNVLETIYKPPKPFIDSV